MKKIISLLSCCLLSVSSTSIVVSCSKDRTALDNSNQNNSDIDSHEIAHAGGEIDGHFYTNTLDALENSYNNGLRYFEFDFWPVKDKNGNTHWVCTHNWEKWGWQSGTNDGKTDYVPTYEEFTSKKLWGKYTALTFELANEWFAKHKDAFLVTDKTDDPEYFSNNFCDKNRLRMELFSLDSINWSIKNKFEGAMISFDLLFYGDDNEREQASSLLENNKIKYLVSGYTDNEYLTNKLKKFHNNGTTIFMYFSDSFQNEQVTAALKQTKAFIDGYYIDDSKYRFNK